MVQCRQAMQDRFNCLKKLGSKIAIKHEGNLASNAIVKAGINEKQVQLILSQPDFKEDMDFILEQISTHTESGKSAASERLNSMPQNKKLIMLMTIKQAGENQSNSR